MISPNEIRKGNFYSPPSPHVYFRVDEIEYLHQGVGKLGMHSLPGLHPFTWYLKDLKGIPITLLNYGKCGFTQYAAITKKSEYGNIIVAKVLKDEKDSEFNFEFYDNFLRVYVDHHLIYTNKFPLVHELQNIYFMLIGTELKMELV